MHLLLSALDRPSAERFVFVHEHAQHGVLDALIARPIWLLRSRSREDNSPGWGGACPFLVLSISEEFRTRAMIDIMVSRHP